MLMWNQLDRALALAYTPVLAGSPKTRIPLAEVGLEVHEISGRKIPVKGGVARPALTLHC